MEVEELGSDDARAAAQLWSVVGLTRAWNDPLDDFIKAIDGTTSAVLGIKRFDGLIGTVMVGFDGHRGWVYYLAVAPAEQGKGFGADLMAGAEEWLRRRGALKVQLMVRHTNPGVLGFYEKLGYEDAETTVMGRWL